MEYTVIITRQPGMRWRATVPALPECVAEAATRDEVLVNIQEQIKTFISQSEVVRLQVPIVTTPEATAAEAVSTPWHWSGVFQDDPTWGDLFDELERQRDEYLIEP
jgi:predicted RNase H-like HicB family nuclease